MADYTGRHAKSASRLTTDTPDPITGYAVIMTGGNVYQDRNGRYNFGRVKCFFMTIWPRHACYHGSIKKLPMTGRIPGYIPPFPPEGSWEA